MPGGRLDVQLAYFPASAASTSAAPARPPWVLLTLANVTLRDPSSTNAEGYAVSAGAS